MTAVGAHRRGRSWALWSVIAAAVTASVLLPVGAAHATGAASAGLRPASLTTTRAETLVNTHTGTAAPRRPLLGGETVATYVFGYAGIPGDGAAAARLHVQLDSATGSGIVSVHHGDTRDPHPLVLSYTKGRTTDGVALVGLGQSGRLVIENVSSARVQVHIWVTGYTTMANVGGDRWTASQDADAGGANSNAGASEVTVASLSHLRARYPVPTSDDYAQELVSGWTGFVFGGSGGTAVRAYDIRTGRTLWSVGGFGQVGSMAIYGDYLYVSYLPGITGSPVVAAVSLTTRAVVWRSTLLAATDDGQTAQVGPTPLVVDGGVVLVGTGTVEALDAGTGRPLWLSGISDGVAVAQGGRTLERTADGIAVVDIRTARPRWTMQHADGNPIMAGDRIVVVAPRLVVGYALGGCGRAECRPLWYHATGAPTTDIVDQGALASATSTLVAVVITTETAPDGGVRDDEITQLLTLDARRGTLMVDRAATEPYRTDHPTFGGTPVIAGGAVLVELGPDLDSVATTCRGACGLHVVRRGADVVLSGLTVARGLLIGEFQDSDQPVAYSIG